MVVDQFRLESVWLIVSDFLQFLPERLMKVCPWIAIQSVTTETLATCCNQFESLYSEEYDSVCGGILWISVSDLWYLALLWIQVVIVNFCVYRLLQICNLCLFITANFHIFTNRLTSFDSKLSPSNCLFYQGCSYWLFEWSSRLLHQINVTYLNQNKKTFS